MERTPQVDMSIAAALVIDESGSMDGKLPQTCAIAYTLMDALDGIGAKSMAVGFRTKWVPYDSIDWTEFQALGCHRSEGITYDVFKGWQDTFRVAAPRLNEIKAMGGTPMADGIEFALKELSGRPEGHRIMFVLTDGQPNGGHGNVMKSQLKRAADAGILVIGVGLGRGSEYVGDTFADSVYAEDLDKLPKLLVAKLETLVRTRHTAAKRGRTVRAA
jgi:nitric oxide reductase activation protein